MAETVLRATNADDALASFVVALEQGLYNARAAGSRVEMPEKVKLTGFYSYADNAIYNLAVESTPETTVNDTQTNEQAIVEENVSNPIRTEVDVTDDDPSTDYVYDDTGLRVTTRVKGAASNSESTLHPTQVTTQTKDGSDRTYVDHEYDDFT